jgi:prolyl 4-hydroxylase
MNLDTTKSLKELEIDPKLFIGGFYIDPKICDDMNNWFNEIPDDAKTEGRLSVKGYGSELIVDKAVKDTIEFQMPDPYLQDEATKNILLSYLEALDTSFTQYNEKYNNSILQEGTYNFLVQPPQIQRYPAGGSFNMLHCERYSETLMGLRRHLVYMTYFDDIEDGGGTEFPFQNFTSKSKKGLTLIWPAGWTHMHRGVPAPNQEKTIITGWAHIDVPQGEDFKIFIDSFV